MPLRWDFVDVVERIRQLLDAAETELRLEQAVYGLDVRDERALNRFSPTGSNLITKSPARFTIRARLGKSSPIANAATWF